MVLADDPNVGALQEVRLTINTCDMAPAVKERIIAKRIADMRANVDDAFRTWAESQPDCWEQYRARSGTMTDGYSGYGIGSMQGSSRGEAGAPLSGGHSVPKVRLGSSTVNGRPAPPSPRRAKSASTTNLQVAGVDEADFVKTDGQYVYVVSNGKLRIIEAMNPRVLSTTRLDGQAREMFITENRAVVYTSSRGQTRRCTYGYDCQFAADGTSTMITVYDISNRSAPRSVRRIELSGSLLTARRIGNAVHTVVADADRTEQLLYWPRDLEMCGTLEASVRAKFAALKRENERIIRATGVGTPTLRENGVETALCIGYETRLRHENAYTTLVSIDLLQDQGPAATSTVATRPGAVYASVDALYLASSQHKPHSAGRWYSFYSSSEEVTEIHKFRIGSSPGDTRYLGSGIVPGHVLNQFAMDEWNGNLRIATTQGRVPNPNVRSTVSVLSQSGENLVRVGRVTNIAPEEDIRAVRFDGDRGYIVTFKKTDPLFVLDLHDPLHPRIVGELKIPGFSTYIHRIGRNHLLSIGFDADDLDEYALFNGVMLQLFDVTDSTKPRLIHKETIGTRGTSSEAIVNHLAFNYLEDRKLLAFPMTICEGGGRGRYGTLTFSGLLVYEVDIQKGFKRLGGIDHGTANASCGTWWSNATSMVKRSLFMDDLVYSIALDRIKVQRLGNFRTDVASIDL
ncbi:MAG TPA: beta-propeller domain-containing protein [Polyangiaceae bacterium]|nr:beta-propeller domain-containing protein [Polyangiaceae bacterium]HQM09817.1 beta-propeller domain-containing protein [Polyangiaceae bacterium]